MNSFSKNPKWEIVFRFTGASFADERNADIEVSRFPRIISTAAKLRSTLERAPGRLLSSSENLSRCALSTSELAERLSGVLSDRRPCPCST